MREKLINGWVLGKDGMHHVNPNWKGEEGMVNMKAENVVNIKKQGTEKLVRDGEELVRKGEEVGIVAVQKMKKKAGLVENVGSAEKKKKKLGPRGLRRNGGYDYRSLPAPNYSGDGQKVAQWVLAEKNMKREGYGYIPFKPASFKSKKAFQCVGDVYYDCYMLARPREDPKHCIDNPFSEETCVGDRQPLPR